MSRSTSSRPSSSSRTAPPTTQATTLWGTSRPSSSIDDHPPRAPRVDVDPADELVVDRPGDARMRLGKHARPEDRHRRADGLLVVELDGEGVHRDGADRPSWLSGDAHLCARQVAPEAVRVAERHDPDPGRLLGDEAASVAGAFAGLQELHLREVAAPPERRLEPVRGGVLPEWREPVERDAATGSVEA